MDGRVPRYKKVYQVHRKLEKPRIKPAPTLHLKSIIMRFYCISLNESKGSENLHKICMLYLKSFRVNI